MKGESKSIASAPLAGLPLATGTLALSLCTFMQVLDYSIANVSIPYISGDLAVSVEEGTWVITMFAVGNAIALPLTGWCTTRFGAVRTILTSTALFTLFSVLCGLSWNLNVLVLMRFIQGLVSGPLIPLSQSLLIMSFPESKKNLALALWNMVAVVGPISGPILGGWITFDHTWPWIFYINLPVGLFCCAAVWGVYRSRETKMRAYPVDRVGLLLLVVGVATLQIMLDKGQQYDWWRSVTIRILAVTSAVSLLFWVMWEVFHEHPIVDLRLFGDRNFAVGTIVTALSYMTLFGAIVVTPLWLQTRMGYTSFRAGLVVSTMGVAPFCTLFFAVYLMQRIRLRVLVAVALLILGTSFLYFTTFTTDVSLRVVALSRLYMGFGLSLYMAPLVAISFSYLPADKLAMGQGMFHFFRVLMGGIGTSIFITLWERRAVHHHHYLVEHLNRFNPTASGLLDTPEGRAMTDETVWKQAYMLSTNDIFWSGSIIFFVLAVAVIFLFKKNRKVGLILKKITSTPVR
ncbi:MAG: DHA2 family efflux MFS transporter permease subunit [Simkaniaceae bacterium]|nr:DHA2 family efflux MFS transporter permease subunit [Simkaniaceae bacterium]